MNDPTDAQEAVANGVAFLDERVGRNWREETDSSTLVMSDYCQCVLAQIGGSTYTDEIRVLNLLGHEAWRYGFDIPEIDTPQEWGYEELQYEWEQELENGSDS